MVPGPDNGPPSDCDDSSSDVKLSRKAEEVKKQIQEGRYHVNLESLAERLLEEEALTPSQTPLPVPKSADVRNDQKPKKEG